MEAAEQEARGETVPHISAVAGDAAAVAATAAAAAAAVGCC